MSDENEKPEGSGVVSQARARYQRAVGAWGDTYTSARDDLRFLSDEKDAQWDPAIAQERRDTGRQVITLDQTNQFVHQVVNDIRQNTPSINIIPEGDGADMESAEEIKGIIRGIEYESNADSAYDMAAENAVKARLGFIRVDHDYAKETGFEQKLCIRRVVNPLACYLDPSSVEIDGRDAEWGFILDRMKVSEFKRLYPEKTPASFDVGVGESGKAPEDDDELMIAEYFVKEEMRVPKHLLDDGTVVDELPEGVKARATRSFSQVKIHRYKLSGADELEATTFPGKYIPLVPVYGEEAWEDGKRKLKSLIAPAKSGQQLYNLWRSLEADMLLRAQRAPIVAPEGATEAFAKDYKNPDKAAVLRYTPYDGQDRPLPAPHRMPAPEIPTGIVNAAREMVDDIKASMGMYAASIGAKSNETSGIAIQRRQAEGDVATLHFGDNLVKSITQVGRILVAALPEIYDTARMLTSIGAEDQPKMVAVNSNDLAPGQKNVIDLKRGQYSVRVTTGASYTTKRQEAAQFFSDVVTRQPNLMNVAGDLLFKNMDFPGAPALAERLKKTIPANLLEGEDGAPAVDVEKQQMAQQIAEAQQIIAGLQQQMKSGIEEAQIKAQSDMRKSQADIATAQINQNIANANLEIKRIDFAMKQLETEQKRMELQAQALQPPPAPPAGPQSGIAA